MADNQPAHAGELEQPKMGSATGSGALVFGHLTDLSVLREMLTRSGVVFTEEARPAAGPEPNFRSGLIMPAGMTLTLSADIGPRNFRYGDRNPEALFYFDEHGALYGVGTWA